MKFFELQAADISTLGDGDLREMVGRLCEAEIIQAGGQPSCVTWGGAQEAPDGGLDVRVKDAATPARPNFVPRKNTGFQVKKNGMSKVSCTNEMLDKANLKAIIIELANRKGAYIIVSGKDDCSEKMLKERRDGMGAAVDGLANKDDLLLDFYGRDRLSGWLRQHPGVALWVRWRLGKPLSGWMPFGRWAATPSNVSDDFLLDEHPCFIDQNSSEKEPVCIADGIKLAREKLRLPGRTVRITGLSGVGKTRFAQALFETNVGSDSLPCSGVIYADLGNDLTPTASELVSYLIANRFSTFVVLDNCPSDVHRALQKQITQVNAKLKLLTIEYDISDDRPEDTEVLHLEPSSEATVSQLIQMRFAQLGPINANKVAEFSGGNARLAFALASRVEADETLTNFGDEELFQRLFSQRKQVAHNLLENATILSLVYSFNVSEADFNDELSVLAKIGGTKRRELYQSHAELLRRQISQKRANWRAVLPHALANRLARRALQDIAPSDINAELFKPQNLRLFTSCAHRIGFLHDFDPARHLANSWIQPGAPLSDLASCNGELLLAFEHIAPVFPESVLSALESSSISPAFASRENPNFYRFVRLLCKLAYEDNSFDRAATIILKFAETENSGESCNSVLDQFRSLFALHLSGTLASPRRRQEFLSRLLTSANPKHREIAQELLSAALQANHWSSMDSFAFGARNRDSGWSPNNRQDKLDWYQGFINLLKPYLTLNVESSRCFARRLLSNNFRSLWSSAHCFDIVEEVVRANSSGGSWSDMWISIKDTIDFDGKRHSPDLLLRLKALERFTAPSDICSEIEAYVLTNTFEHRTEAGSDTGADILNKIVSLGRLAAVETDYLTRYASKLWTRHIDALSSFGKGLAIGSTDISATFELLIALMQSQELKHVEPILFHGFINAVYSQDQGLARQLQERALCIPELKPHFVYLLAATPIDRWGAKKLLDVARSGEIEAQRFRHIAGGRIHETILDSELVDILEALNSIENGFASILDILSIRFFLDEKRDYEPSKDLLRIGRMAISKLLTMKIKLTYPSQHSIDRVIKTTISQDVADSEIVVIIDLICSGIINLYKNNFDTTEILVAIIKYFPELLLAKLLENAHKSELRLYIFSAKKISLNHAPIDRLIKWCAGDEARIKLIANSISMYSSQSLAANCLPPKARATLSSHALGFLEESQDKKGFVELIFNNTWPNFCSGSLAKMLEVRLEAFSELLKHSSPEVREFVKSKIPLIEESINKNRMEEVIRNRQFEQRFE